MYAIASHCVPVECSSYIFISCFSNVLLILNSEDLSWRGKFQIQGCFIHCLGHSKESVEVLSTSWQLNSDWLFYCLWITSFHSMRKCRAVMTRKLRCKWIVWSVYVKWVMPHQLALKLIEALLNSFFWWLYCFRSICLPNIQTWASCPFLLRSLLMPQKIPQHSTL